MISKRVTSEIRKYVVDRAKGCCEYCLSKARFSTKSFSIDHIIPLSKNGDNSLDNLALSCQGCNNHKYNKVTGTDPITNDQFALFNPRIHKWENHFHWSNDYSIIIGITAIGRATVETLKLNRQGITNLRSILFKEGEHPPLLI